MGLIHKKMRKIHLPTGELNIVSLMDVMTTLIFFIIMMAGFGDFFSIPANPLEMGTPQKEKKPVFTLKVTVMSDQKIAVWVGPIKDLKVENKDELKELLHTSFMGNEYRGYRREITHTDNTELLKEVQKVLINLKKLFPNEMKAVVAIGGKVKYQGSVDTISTIRTLASEAEPLLLKNLLGKEEKTRVLFPEIVLSEWDDGSVF
jgi:biopolymer transport protein ExbD